VVTRNQDEQNPSPHKTAESEEKELAERLAAERSRRESAHSDRYDPREDDGWSQPESSAQKGAVRDEEEG
jgi:hypothetical protein